MASSNDQSDWFFDDPFQRRSRLYIYWFNSAKDLHAAATVLWYSYSGDNSSGEPYGLGAGFDLKAAIPNVFALNAGLSLELLLKACIVRKDGELKIFTHCLNKLATAADFTPNPTQTTFLYIFTRYIIWLGKYPIPKSREDDQKAANIINNPSNFIKKSPSGSSVRRKPELKINLENYNKIWT